MIALSAITGVAILGILLDQTSNKEKESFVEFETEVSDPSELKKSDINDNNYEMKLETVSGKTNMVVKSIVNDFVPQATNQNMVGIFDNEPTPHLTKLGNFTGTDNLFWKSKKETSEFFVPKQDDVLPIDKSDNVRLENNRFTQSMTKRHDMKPTEALQIGPGINVSETEAAGNGGFNAGISTVVIPTLAPNTVRKTPALSSVVAGNKSQISTTGAMRLCGLQKLETDDKKDTFNVYVGSSGNGKVIKNEYRSIVGPVKNQKEQINYSFGQLS